MKILRIFSQGVCEFQPCLFGARKFVKKLLLKCWWNWRKVAKLQVDYIKQEKWFQAFQVFSFVGKTFVLRVVIFTQATKTYKKESESLEWGKKSFIKSVVLIQSIAIHHPI